MTTYRTRVCEPDKPSTAVLEVPMADADRTSLEYGSNSTPSLVTSQYQKRESDFSISIIEDAPMPANRPSMAVGGNLLRLEQVRLEVLK